MLYLVIIFSQNFNRQKYDLNGKLGVTFSKFMEVVP